MLALMKETKNETDGTTNLTGRVPSTIQRGSAYQRVIGWWAGVIGWGGAQTPWHPIPFPRQLFACPPPLPA